MNIRTLWYQQLGEIFNLYHAYSTKQGMSDSECMILYALYDAEQPMAQADLAHATGLAKQTIHSAVKKMRQEDILLPEQRDGKAKYLTVTDKGRQILEEKIKPLAEMENAIFAAWKPNEAEQFLTLAERFRRMLEKEVDDFASEQ